jgi:hypothetical protein
MGNDDCKPSGLGTIVRITAHQVEVLWEGARPRRYRRTQLHNLRHVKPISAAADSFVGACVASPAAKQNQDILFGQRL